MTPQMVRLLAGFLAAFVLVSLASKLPDTAAVLSRPGLLAEAGSLLLWVAAGLLIPIGAVIAWRRLHGLARRRAARSPSGGDLPTRIRRAAQGGTGVPRLAREFRLSQDAVRVALGQHGTASPAASPGTSFRGRQATLGRPGARRPGQPGRTSYRVPA